MLIPSTRYFWQNRNRTQVGIIATTQAVSSFSVSVAYAEFI